MCNHCMKTMAEARTAIPEASPWAPSNVTALNLTSTVLVLTLKGSAASVSSDSTTYESQMGPTMII